MIILPKYLNLNYQRKENSMENMLGRRCMKISQRILCIVCGIGGIFFLVHLIKRGTLKRRMIGAIVAFIVGCFMSAFYKGEDNDANNR